MLNLKWLEVLENRSDKKREVVGMLRRVRQVLWSLVAVSAAVLTYWAVFFWGGEPDINKASSGASFKPTFELIDHQGEIRTEDDFEGKWLLVFFGFVNCPDVCPTTLAEVSAVVHGLGEQASDVQPLFISVDPERDTPEVLAEFIPRFEAGIIGLTGSPERIAATKARFHIFYEKISDENAPGQYTMSHSSQLFLFGPDGGYLRSWAYGASAEEITADLLELIGS